MSITERYRKLRKEVPDHVRIVMAVKTRTPEEIREVIEAGATDLGENYVQEGERAFEALGNAAENVRWHMIGSLQKNKINKALRLFDVYQTLDSADLADALNLRAGKIGKRVSVYMEVNVGEESAKAGIPPEYAEIKKLARHISALEHLKLEGLMTMGPFWGDPESLRPYFRKTKEIFDKIRALELPDTDLRYLSMGMSDSYRVAIEEGSSMIRMGTAIFGPRVPKG